MKIRRLEKTLVAAIVDEILVVVSIGSMVVMSQRGLSEGQPCEITGGYHCKEILIRDLKRLDSIRSMDVISCWIPECVNGC